MFLKARPLLLVGVIAVCGGWRHGNTGGGSPATLSAQSAIADGSDHSIIGVTTNIGSGTWFWDFSTTCGASPTAAQVKAGSVGAGDITGSQAVSGSGAQTANPSGLSGVTTYCAYFVQNTTGGDSNVLATSGFATGGTLTITFTQTAAFQAAQGASFGAVVSNLQTAIQNCFSPSINTAFTYTLDYAASGGLASTAVSPWNDLYTNLRPKLVALNNKNSIQTSLFSNPPANDPTGLNSTYYFGKPFATMLGYATGSGSFATTTVSSSFTFNTTANGACGASQCLWAVLWHEISEGMGRQWGQDVSAGLPSLVEFSSYTGAGVRGVTSGSANRYPSSDAGSTSLIGTSRFATSGDNGDWNSTNVDAFTATDSGAGSPISVADIKAMASDGWGLSHSCRVTAGL